MWREPWQTFTGKTAIHADTGQTFEDVAEAARITAMMKLLTNDPGRLVLPGFPPVVDHGGHRHSNPVRGHQRESSPWRLVMKSLKARSSQEQLTVQAANTSRLPQATQTQPFKPVRARYPTAVRRLKNEATILRELLDGKKLEIRERGPRARSRCVRHLAALHRDALKGNTKSAAFILNPMA